MELAEEVDGFLRRTGMSASRFGRLVARDPSLVPDLRRGRRPFGRLRARILAQLGTSRELGREFVDTLSRSAAPAGFIVAGVAVLPWASSNLVGEQAVCRLRPGPHVDRGWAERLPEKEWNLPFLVADVDVSWDEDGPLLTALLLPGT